MPLTSHCPSCKLPVADNSSGRCANCGAAFDQSSEPTAFKPPSGGNDGAAIHSTESADGARFPAGTILGERYRIVSLLGRGGMGEVYKADDLKLKQIVALKFLPDAVGLDGAALSRFHNEVRITRQISHPNVCRVYDVGEAKGLHFLSMEYIDGEDLSLLLRRIGRLPGDKATEIARQICAGLAAAHENNVLHRDLKPANIMIDGRGKARVTDFGVAVVAKELLGREAASGTPAYMAPEQLAGKEVTQRSDIYSLGLVLYELFTGKRVYASNKIPDLIRLHESSAPISPSSHVEHLDPLVDRVILRCLEKEPAKRPATALQVAAALPGGDPLAAALAAGETPSPEMVAAAGEKGGLRPAIAMALLVAIIASLGILAVIGGKSGWRAQMLAQSSPETLRDKAREVIRGLGYTDPPADSAFGFESYGSFIDWAAQNTPSTNRWREFTNLQPAPITFWYRQSPRYLESNSIGNLSTVTMADPGPASASGMVSLSLDPGGRLTWLTVVPPQVDPPTETPAPRPDWAPLFAAAGLEASAFTSTASTWTPPVASDVRAAWTGTYPGQPGIPMRIEAATYLGRPVHFAVIRPWTRPWLVQSQPVTTGGRAASLILASLVLLVLIVAALLARKNLRLGRGDRRGASRLALFIVVLTILQWIFGADYSPTMEAIRQFFLVAIGQALLNSGIVWLLYIGLEPYVRRRLPETIISWNRVLAGELRDPLVGIHVLIGVLLGTVFAIFPATAELVRLSSGIPPTNFAPTDSWMGGSRFIAFGLLNSVVGGVFATLSYFFLTFLLYAMTRRRWLAGLALALILTVPTLLTSDAPVVTGTAVVLYFVLMVAACFRVGLLAVAVGHAVFYTLFRMPMGTDLTVWHSTYLIASVAWVLAVAAWAFHTSLAGQKVFSGSLLDE